MSDFKECYLMDEVSQIKVKSSLPIPDVKIILYRIKLNFGNFLSIEIKNY
jgi:hypothetical protein